MKGNRLKTNLRVFRRILNKVQDVLAIAMLIVLCVVVFLQVFFRYALNSPLAWSEELARFMFIWLVYVGAAIVLRTDSHMSLDYFINLMPEKFRVVVDILGKIIVSMFLVLGIRESFTIIRITMPQLSPSLDIPMGLIYLALPVSFVLMLLDFATRIVLGLRQGDN